MIVIVASINLNDMSDNGDNCERLMKRNFPKETELILVRARKFIMKCIPRPSARGRLGLGFEGRRECSGGSVREV